MKVKLLVKRDGCAAGTVVDYGDVMARWLVSHKEAEAFVPEAAPPPKKKVADGPEPPVKKKTAPFGADRPAPPEPAEAGFIVKED